MGTPILLRLLTLPIDSFAEGPSDAALRARRLDPVGRDGFGRRLA